MRKLLFIFLLFLTGLSFAQQRETFDVATYTVPKGWKKVGVGPDVSVLSITDNQKGTYCQIAIYKTTVSKGNLEADFKSEWDELIVKSYKPTEAPTRVSPESEDGWDGTAGTAPFEFSGSPAVAMLITMSSHGRCMSIVIVTNTADYQSAIEDFLSSAELQKLEPVTQIVQKDEHDAKPSTSAYQFSTSNFDDGWTSTVQEDWVEATKGDLKVLIHYPNQKADEYNTVLLDKIKNSWDILVAPRYRSASNFEFKPISNWQSIEFAEADVVENRTGRNVHVVLFRYNYSGGKGTYLEFITKDKKTFEQEFCAYHPDPSGWENVEKMVNYNKFAIAGSDLKGTWSTSFTGTTQFVNIHTGAAAGMTAHASTEKFEFGPGNTYRWSLGFATGVVGNLKAQSAKSNGKFSLPDNWQVSFSDIEGKPKTFNAHFSCVKGSRVLWLGDTGFARIE